MHPDEESFKLTDASVKMTLEDQLIFPEEAGGEIIAGSITVEIPLELLEVLGEVMRVCNFDDAGMAVRAINAYDSELLLRDTAVDEIRALIRNNYLLRAIES